MTPMHGQAGGGGGGGGGGLGGGGWGWGVSSWRLAGASHNACLHTESYPLMMRLYF